MSLLQVDFSYSQGSLKIEEFVWFEDLEHHIHQHPLPSPSYQTVVPLRVNEMGIVLGDPGAKMFQTIRN